MRSTNSVRSPKLAGSGIRENRNGEISLGDTLRKAKRDLFFTRCVYGILAVLVITAVVALYLLGYVDMLIDWFYSLM